MFFVVQTILVLTLEKKRNKYMLSSKGMKIFN